MFLLKSEHHAGEGPAFIKAAWDGAEGYRLASATASPASVGEPGLSQAIGEGREILRSADGKPIRKIGQAQGGIELPQMIHCPLGLRLMAHKRMARRDHAHGHQEAGQ